MDAVTVKIPPASAASDTKLVSRLTGIVNTVYAETEQDIFAPGYRRTNPDEISSFLSDGLLAVAYTIATEEVLGCVFIKRLSESLGEFGMLALDAAHRGGGLGRGMALFAEDHCRNLGCTTMQLELLVPSTFKHAFKERLQAWYLRMGYELVKLGSFEKDYPSLAPQLAGPTEYRVFEKKLV